MEKKIIGPVPHTTRQLVQLSDGRELERQMLYMHEVSWEKLRYLCIRQQIGSSKFIAKLIDDAYYDVCEPEWDDQRVISD